MSFLGVDIGTTGCKAAAYSQEGVQLSEAYQEYPLLSPRPGWAELDPDVLWDSVQTIVGTVSSQTKQDPIQGLSIAVLGEAIIPINTDGTPLSNCIVSFDNRSLSQYKQFLDHVSSEKVFNTTGLFPEPHYSLFKLMWWRQNAPEIYENTWKFLCVGDYIGYKLGLKPVMDHSIATRTLAFDVHQLKWSEYILKAAGIETSKLPETAPSGTMVGEISQKISKVLNLRSEPLLILGGLDQACAALGAGVIHSGDTLLSLGTVAALGPVFSSPTLQMREDKILSMPHVLPKKKITFGATIGGGSVLRWYRDQLGYEEREEAQRSNRNIYEVIIDQISDKPTNLLIIPHFSGSRFAFNDPASEAIISGLTFNSTKPDLIQALLEGIAYELLIIRDRFVNAGLPIPSLNAVGGGSQSDKWLQIIADSMQIPIQAMKISEAGTLGAALLSASALLESKSLPEKVREIVKVRKTLEPRTMWAPYHTERVAEYKELYQRMKGLRGSAPSTSDPLE